MRHLITEEKFNSIKDYSRWHSTRKTSFKFDIHLSTAINIKGSKNYEMYRELVKAEHQPTKYSLAKKVLDLHRKTFDKKDNKYFPPMTAKKAIADLLR